MKRFFAAGGIESVLTESAVHLAFGVHAERAYTARREATLLLNRVGPRPQESGG
jgi:hypothetical protein